MQELELTPEPGVIATLWAEDGGFDMGGGEGGDGGEDLDLGDGGAGDGGDGGEDLEQEQQRLAEEEKVDGRKGSKEFREALKAWEATPEGAKFAKTARADHFRVQELAAIEPGGVTAIREKYALLESIGGPEALTTLQERVAGADAVDAGLASGDPKVLESLGPDFDPGLAKLTPQILDRVMRSNPEAYAQAILPHLMSGLAGSPMVGDLNRMVDVLQAPHLDEKGKIAAITKLLGNIGAWWDANEKKAGEIKAMPAAAKNDDLTQREQKFEQEQQAAHWKNNISPVAAQYETQKFEELFKPFDVRLKLDPAAKADLKASFKAKMGEAAKADAAYMKQMAIYRKQKNPDAAVVSNFVKAAINRHSKTVLESVVKARYGRFLGGKKTTTTTTTQPGVRSGSGGGAGSPTIVSVRPTPDQIDYTKTSEADQWNKIYTLKDGRKVKWVKPA